VLANTEKFRVRSEKFHGGGGLRRCNRSRGFCAKLARHRNLRDNYRIFQGLNRKNFTAQFQWASTVPQIPVDFGHLRSREAGQMKEDDEGIPFHTLLTTGTHRGDRILRRKSRRLFSSSVLGG
jgi:hypothetical protein